MTGKAKTAALAVWEYVRRAATPFLLNLMFGLTMFAVAMISIVALKIILMVVLLGCTVVVDFVFMRSVGEKSYKIMLDNETKKKNAAVVLDEWGEQKKEKVATYKEYRVYKGFVFALIASLPAIVLMVVAGITKNGFVRLALWFVSGWSIIPIMAISMNASYYFGFIMVALITAVCGVGYIFGGNKERMRRFMLERRTQQINAVRNREADKH